VQLAANSEQLKVVECSFRTSLFRVPCGVRIMVEMSVVLPVQRTLGSLRRLHTVHEHLKGYLDLALGLHEDHLRRSGWAPGSWVGEAVALLAMNRTVAGQWGMSTRWAVNSEAKDANFVFVSDFHP